MLKGSGKLVRMWDQGLWKVFSKESYTVFTRVSEKTMEKLRLNPTPPVYQFERRTAQSLVGRAGERKTSYLADTYSFGSIKI